MSVKKTLPVDNNNIEAVKKSLSLKERSCWWKRSRDGLKLSLHMLVKSAENLEPLIKTSTDIANKNTIYLLVISDDEEDMLKHYLAEKSDSS
ncbi:hypothetical protein Patl1_33375 [Pistacia atlantica]|uniref:Uncharacterized protein n=1 Tax=Pistacia atlantica TaxID=434234 RepID=A0ACC0ZXA3_9ROSI|nr:hypothetical protein Patl1_33375 [Pistacia atlantica]